MGQDNHTIVLVDDEPLILSGVSRMLRSAGYEVHTCELWAGVARLVREVEPDLVLLDYNMPSLKGDDICQILKRNVDQNMKIFLFSAEPESDLITITDRCGADGYIQKNTPAHELQRIVEDLLVPDSSLAV